MNMLKLESSKGLKRTASNESILQIGEKFYYG